MQAKTYRLRDGIALVLREATVEDTRALVAYVEGVSGESDFLTFGPGEFGINETQEEEFLRNSRDAENRLYLLALIDNTIVGSLMFSAGHRPRVRHLGDFGITVRKSYWGRGIGGLMLDVLIEWARGNGIIKKVNLRVRTDNRRAIALYENKGFVIEGTVRKEIFFNGTYFDNYLMGLEL
jgi:RimJ/RimL family protein N-acetyltransferase